ncbi:hypothetical protein Tco_0133204 [Tanacetum coccineum]
MMMMLTNEADERWRRGGATTPADSTTVCFTTPANQPYLRRITDPFETDQSMRHTTNNPAYPVKLDFLFQLPVPTTMYGPYGIAPPPASPIRSLGYRAAMIRLRAEAASTSHSLPLPPPIILLLEVKGITLGPRYEVGGSSSAAAARPAGGLREDYGFVATMDREIMHDIERDVGYWITDSWDEIVEAKGLPSADRRRQRVITEMLAADRRRQKQFTEALKLMKGLHTQMAELQ